MTKEEAVRDWVRGFNAVPTRMITKLWELEPEDWQEVTCAEVTCAEDGSCAEVTCAEAACAGESTCAEEAVCVEAPEAENALPMWGTMWSFEDKAGDYWLEEKGGLKMMSQCGFRIYRSEEFGYFFGLDGAGYNFYDAHWTPLYEARGMRWHDEEISGS